MFKKYIKKGIIYIEGNDGYKKANNECYMCKQKFNNLKSFNITIDHLQERCFGGNDNIENLELCCRSCNSKKNKGIKNNDIRKPIIQYSLIVKYTNEILNKIYYKEDCKYILDDFIGKYPSLINKFMKHFNKFKLKISEKDYNDLMKYIDFIKYKGGSPTTIGD